MNVISIMSNLFLFHIVGALNIYYNHLTIGSSSLWLRRVKLRPQGVPVSREAGAESCCHDECHDRKYNFYCLFDHNQWDSREDTSLCSYLQTGEDRELSGTGQSLADALWDPC